MLKKTINYTDFDGNSQSEVHYFNLNVSEIMEMELTENGLVEKFQGVIERGDGAEIIKTYRDLIAKSYGIRGADGKSFKKSEAISEEFESTLAYDALFVELMGHPGSAAAFFNGVIPAQFSQSQEKVDEIANQTLEQVKAQVKETVQRRETGEPTKTLEELEQKAPQAAAEAADQPDFNKMSKEELLSFLAERGASKQ